VPVTQNVTLPFKPKALLVFTSGMNSSGFADIYKLSVGFSNGTSTRALGLASGDVLSKSSSGRAFGKNIVELVSNSGVGTAAEANVTRFTINNFTMKWTTNDNKPVLINYIALGGNDLVKSSVSSFSSTTSATTQNVTLGFRPDFLMFMHAAKTSETSTSINGYLSYGFATPLSKNAIAVASVNNTSPTNTCETQRTDSALVALNPSNCGFTIRISNVLFNSNGFQIQWSSTPTSADKIYFMALKGGAYVVGNFTQPTSAVPVKQTIKETTQPNGLILSSFNHVANNAAQSNNRLSFGVSDNSTSEAVWSGDKKGVTTTVTARSENTTQIITLATEQATGSNSITNATASILTMNTTGFTLNWAKDDSTAKQILYTVFGRNPIDNNIIVTEKTVPTNQTNFNFTSTTLTPSSFTLANYANSTDTKIFSNLSPGTYNVTETSNAHYISTSSCNDGSSINAINLKAGQTITCTIANTLIPTSVTTVSVGSLPDSMVFNPSNSDMYIGNQFSNTASVMSGTSVVATVPTGIDPFGFAYDSANNYIYVPNNDGDSVSIISDTTNIANLTSYCAPQDAVFNPSNNYIYVVNYCANTVSVISNTTKIANVSVGSNPVALAYNPSNNDIYVTNYFSNTVSIISGTTNIANVTVGFEPAALAFNPSNNYMYVSNSGSNTVSVISNTTKITDITVGPSFAAPGVPVFNPTNNYMYIPNGRLNTVSVLSNTTKIASITTGNSPQGGVFDSSDNFIYIPNYSSNTVSVISGITNIANVTVGASPNLAAFNPVNNNVYVTNGGSNSVSIISGY